MGLWNSLTCKTYVVGDTIPARLAEQPLMDTTSPSSDMHKRVSVDGKTASKPSIISDRRSRGEFGQIPRYRSWQAGQDELIQPHTSIKHGSQSNGNPTQAGSDSHVIPLSPRERSAINLKTAIALLEELKKTATVEDLITLHKTLLPSNESVALSPSNVYAQVEELTKKPVLEPVPRRRSFFTPGIATREKESKATSRTSNNNLKTASGQQPAGNTWTSDVPEYSMLLEPSASRGGLVPSLSRAETPSDMDYARLGYRLGDLRVTNGRAVSPSPSITSSVLPGLPGVDAQHARMPSNNPQLEHSLRATANLITSYPKPKDDVAVMDGNPTEDVGAPSSEIPLQGPGESSPARSPRTSMSDHGHALMIKSTIESSATHIPPIRISNAENIYRSEALANPFLPSDVPLSPPMVPSLYVSADVQDKPLEMIHLKRSESVAHAFNQEARTAAFDKLNGRKPVAHRDVSATSSIYTEVQSDHKISPGNGLMKHDSGYGSQSSSHKSSLVVPEDVPAHNSKGTAETPQAEKQSQGNLADKYVSQSVARTMAGLQQIRQSLSSSQLSEDRARGVVKSTASPSHHSSLSRPLLGEVDPSSPKAPHGQPPYGEAETVLASLTKSQTPTTAEKLQPGPNKLQKKRPSPERATTVERLSDLYMEAIPQVPHEVVTQFTHRLSRHPSMEHLERTYESVSDTQQRSQYNDPYQFRFPSPTPGSGEDLLTERGRIRRRSSLGTEWKQMLRSTSRKSKERKKSLDRDNKQNSWAAHQGEVVILSVADFGTVAQSLGSSPYDIAASRSQLRRSHSSSKGLKHPHQMSRLASSRSMIGMDEKAASQFAQQRSRDRLALVEDSQPSARTRLQDSKGIPPPPMPSNRHRPHSFDLVRDKRMPPMPALPRHKSMTRLESFAEEGVSPPQNQAPAVEASIIGLPVELPTGSDLQRRSLPTSPMKINPPPSPTKPVKDTSGVMQSRPSVHESSNLLSKPGAPTSIQPAERPLIAKPTNPEIDGLISRASTERPDPVLFRQSTERLQGKYCPPVDVCRVDDLSALSVVANKQSTSAQVNFNATSDNVDRIDWARPADFWRQRRMTVKERLLLEQPQIDTTQPVSSPDVRRGPGRSHAAQVLEPEHYLPISSPPSSQDSHQVHSPYQCQDETLSFGTAQHYIPKQCTSDPKKSELYAQSLHANLLNSYLPVQPLLQLRPSKNSRQPSPTRPVSPSNQTRKALFELTANAGSIYSPPQQSAREPAENSTTGNPSAGPFLGLSARSPPAAQQLQKHSSSEQEPQRSQSRRERERQKPHPSRIHEQSAHLRTRYDPHRSVQTGVDMSDVPIFLRRPS